VAVGDEPVLPSTQNHREDLVASLTARENYDDPRIPLSTSLVHFFS
jgi:hypothetical protein